MQKFESSLEVWRATSNFSDNLDHNIMELYNVLVKVRFAAGKTRLDIYCHKPGRRVASQVAERRKTWDLRKL